MNEQVDREVVQLCSDLIRIDTTNRGDGPGPAGSGGAERPAAEYVAEQLSDAGSNRGWSSRRRAAHRCWPGSRAPTRTGPRC
ncbi:MAG: hypothetical protein L0Y54_01835 [Sporichthyaceae bacterium]|nr:hypothetical protein [Sporichthyaceae bacterium]